MAEKIVTRLPAAAGTFAVVPGIDFDTSVSYLTLERVVYWIVIADAEGPAVDRDGQAAGYEALAWAGFNGSEGYCDAYLMPDGSVEVPNETRYSSLKAYAAARGLEVMYIFGDTDSNDVNNDVNALLEKEVKDDAIRLNFKVSLSGTE